MTSFPECLLFRCDDAFIQALFHSACVTITLRPLGALPPPRPRAWLLRCYSTTSCHCRVLRTFKPSQDLSIYFDRVWLYKIVRSIQTKLNIVELSSYRLIVTYVESLVETSFPHWQYVRSARSLFHPCRASARCCTTSTWFPLLRKSYPVFEIIIFSSNRGDNSSGGISWGDNSTGGSAGVTIL